MGHPHKNLSGAKPTTIPLGNGVVDEVDGRDVCGMSERLLLLGTYDGGVMGYNVRHEARKDSSGGRRLVSRVFARSAHVVSFTPAHCQPSRFLLHLNVYCGRIPTLIFLS